MAIDPGDPAGGGDHSFTAIIDGALISQAPVGDDAGGAAPLRLAVKDIIDMAGYRTTLGSRVIEAAVAPAEQDAACLAHYADAGAVVVGRTNLHELAFGASGINTSMGTPVNPLGADLIPGGSSSGSGTAVAAGQCDIAFGTDTGGSVRIPAACCGILGLKTTFGLVPTQGVHPLSPSLDTVGPMAATPAMLRRGWDALAGRDRSGMSAAIDVSAMSVRLLDFDGVTPAVRDALRAAARAIGAAVSPSSVTPEEWDDAIRATGRIIVVEAAAANAGLRDLWPRLQSADALARGAQMAQDVSALDEALEFQRRWIERMQEETASSFVLAPTLECATPTISEAAAGAVALTRFTSPINLAGLPAISVPVTRDAVPISVQLIGPPNSEDALIDMAQRIFVASGDRGASA